MQTITKNPKHYGPFAPVFDFTPISIPEFSMEKLLLGCFLEAHEHAMPPDKDMDIAIVQFKGEGPACRKILIFGIRARFVQFFKVFFAHICEAGAIIVVPSENHRCTHGFTIRR